MDPQELAWAGGMFEGEGCFCYSRRPSAIVVSTDRDVLDRFATAVGFGKMYGPYKQLGIGTKPRFQWQVTGRPRVSRLFHLLAPWLGARRTEKARSVLYTDRSSSTLT